MSLNIFDIIDEYDGNGVKGDKLYKDKVIQLTGYADDIDSTLDKIYVYLRKNQESEPFDDIIKCEMLNDEVDRVSELIQGDKINIIGTCEGKTFYVRFDK